MSKCAICGGNATSGVVGHADCLRNNIGGHEMNDYVYINGQRHELTAEQARQIMGSINLPCTLLADVAEGDTIKLGEHEFIVLEHLNDGTTAVILKGTLPDMKFGSTNNYDGSDVDAACNKFADQLAAIVGADNIVEHTVDLTSNDGLKDYGQVERRASLLTADRYRRYVDTLDKNKSPSWWWLATAFSTPRHNQGNWVLCVSPSGCINYLDHCNGDYGVRPFCILKSTIFVSK